MRAAIPPPFDDPARKPRLALARGVSHGSFFDRYLSGARAMADELGIELLLFDFAPETAVETLEKVARAAPDAVVVSSSSFDAIGPQLAALRNRAVPVVGFDMNGDDPAVPSLEQDDLQIGFMLSKKLAGDCDGEASVININPGLYAPLLKRDRVWQDFKWRYPGLREVARIGTVTESVGVDTEAALELALDEHPEATTILASWDEYARAAARVLSRRKLGDRLRIYSVDISDEDIALMIEPGSPWVATVATDAFSIGRVAVRAAAARMAGERVGRHLLIEPQLITQELLRRYEIRSVDTLVSKLPTFGESRLAWFDWMEALLERTGRKKPIATLEPDRLIALSKDLREANDALQQEIAERKRIEDELRFSNLVLRTQQEASPDGILVVAGDRRVLSFNRRFVEMWGFPEELMEAPHDDVLLQLAARQLADPERFVAEVEAIRRGARDGSHDEIALADGRVFERISAPVLDPEVSSRGRVWFFRDITERKRGEEALREADRRKDEFLAVLSHELRNPLAPIRNSLYVLSRAAPGEERAGRALAVIDRQVSHLTRLVDDLLDVTRIARGKIRLQRERLELGDLVRRTVEDHRGTFVANGLQLEARVGSEAMWLLGDATRLAQVVGNLLGNAVKFTPRGGRVEVSLERIGSQAVLRVRDTGVGISQEMLGRLFVPFSQAAQTLDRSRGGLGLGLALVKGLVELHGGTAAAASEGLDRGAELTVRLPLESPPPERASSGTAASKRPRRVLIIEDNVDSAESLQALLELMGHQVQVALDGPSGLAAARTFSPEVVLCDIGLPGMDGYEVARAFRAEPGLRGALLVALTGYALPEDLKRAADAGFDRHVAKPPMLETLQQILAG